MATIRRRFIVSGRVQGVFFRSAAKSQADMLGLRGWAKNLDNGKVEIVAEGDAGAIERFARWVREGSTNARVTNVESSTEAPEGIAGFRTL